jgi:C4-dicarboxylate-binding protein DctP
MMRKGLIRSAALIGVLIGTATLHGCSESNSLTLRIGAGHPAGPSVYATQMRDFFVPEVRRRVEAETEYTINFVEGYGGSIAQVAETLEAVQNGVLDIGAYCVCFEPAKLFLHNFAYYTPFGPQDSVQAVQVARTVYDKHPWLESQLTDLYGQQLLAINGYDNYHLGSTMPWSSVDDLKGVKIGGAGPNLPWLEYAGVVPVQSSLPDGYLAMQTGVYDGWLMFPSAYFSYKFHEPAPHYTLIGFGAIGGAVIMTMNSDSLQRLPAEVRAIVMEVSQEYENVAAEALEIAQDVGLKNLEESSATIKVLPEEVRQSWGNSLANFPNEMAQEANGRDMPGTEIISSFIEEVTNSGYQWPVNYVID